MIKIIRTSEPSQYEFGPILNESLRLEDENGNEKRMTFDMSVLSIVRGDVERLFRNKCAYCETTTHFPTNGNIDNFRPRAGARTEDAFFKDHYYWLAYDWQNVYLVCNACQKFKRDFFPLVNESSRAKVKAGWDELRAEETLLIDPCYDEPSQHLRFHENGKVTGLNERGNTTIQLLGLNRSELVYERVRSIQAFLIFLNDSKFKHPKQERKAEAYVTELFSQYPGQQFVAALRATYQRWQMDQKGYNRTDSGQYVANWLVDLFDEAAISSPPPTDDFNYQDRDFNVFSIKSVEISNFKNIEHLKFDVAPNSGKDGLEPWLLLLGDNGIGKSSVLHAIAMTLCGNKQLTKLLLQPKDFLRYGSKAGHVKVFSYEHDLPIELHFNEKEFSKAVAKPPTYLLGYGATRLLPKGDLGGRKGRNKWVNIENLFDYSVALSDATTWMLSQRDGLLEERVIPALYDLLDIKGTEKLIFDEKTITITDGATQHSLDVVSDGYKAMIALACDIMKFLSTDIANYHSTKGIVLIDELGNHLHPRWRMKVVGALRRTFPQLQFIVTSHEPLCLRGLEHGEVAVMLTDRDRKVRLLDSSLLPDHNLLKVDQLLTSDLFGLINTMDEETEKLYEDYYALLSKKEEDKTVEDKIKIQEHVETLAGKELMGSTPQEQIIYEVVNEVYAKKLSQEGFKTKAQLRDETVEEVKGLLIEKNLDWI